MSGRTFGTHDHNEWLEEGLGLFVSARALRTQWVQIRRKFKHDQRRNPGGRLEKLLFIRMTGMPRASMLLLAYSAEMYLKSGLIKNFTHCRPGLIDREVRTFGHDLAGIATEINFPLNQHERGQLETLARLLVDSRYPLEPPQQEGWAGTVEYTAKVNARTSQTWSRRIFSELCRLVQKLRIHVQKIDGDEKNPASFRNYKLDRGGYITLRYGGNLSPRVTYRDESNRPVPRTADEVHQLAIAPVGQVKFPHLWPGQTPPGRTVRIVVHVPAADLVSPA